VSIDLQAKFDKYEKQITDNLLRRKSTYENSKCKKSLRARYDRLKDSNDLQIGTARGDHNFLSKLVFPIVKERSLIRNAIFTKNYQGDPLFTTTPIGGTTRETSDYQQSLLNANTRATQFRYMTLRHLFLSSSQYGSTVGYTYWSRSSKTAMKTINDPVYGVIRRRVPTVRENAVTRQVHILDYIQDPHVSEPLLSDINAHMEHVQLSTLIGQYKADPDLYVKDNVEWVIREAKKSVDGINDSSKHKETEGSDYSLNGIDKFCGYAVINIAGNEDDDTRYYFEIVGDKIIRFHQNENDGDEVPYSFFDYYPRSDVWWGNADSEFVQPHENFFNLIMQLSADNALRLSQMIIFHEQGAIDGDAWAHRAANGGRVPVKLMQNRRLQDLVWQFQPQDISMNARDSVLREVKESMQRMSTRPDILRPAAEGGLQNTTATAVNQIEQMGDMLETNVLVNFDFGLVRCGKITLSMLMQHLGNQIGVRARPEDPEQIIEKWQILGDSEINLHTALTKNRSSELVRLQNFITGLQNFKGTADPSWQNVNLIPIIRHWLKLADVGDVDEIYPNVSAQAAPGVFPPPLSSGAAQGPVGQPMMQGVQPAGVM
jgi:hypothetical protein